jgi:hypothetical protein
MPSSFNSKVKGCGKARNKLCIEYGCVFGLVGREDEGRGAVV